MKITDLSLLIEGVVEGNANVTIMGLSGIDHARDGDLIFAMDEDKLDLAETGRAACVLTTQTSRKSTKPLIRVRNPKLAFLMAYHFLHQKTALSYCHPTAVVAASARIGQNTRIDAQAIIEENVTIGDNCHIGPRVVLHQGTVIKNRVVLHSGVIVGGDGFGYLREGEKIYKFPQLGDVCIEDDVEIGANTTIDRGSLGQTVIGEGTKIDNLCHIAHNVKIGKHVIMAAQCGIAGSSVIGDYVTMSGQVAVIDNATVGAHASIGGQSGIIGDIAAHAAVWGAPARDVKQVKKQMAVLAWMARNFSIFSGMKKEKRFS